MRIAVTGATGFVGSRFCRSAIAAGHDLSVLLRSGQSFEHARCLTGRLDNIDALEKLVADVDLLIHIAGVVRAVDIRTFDKVNVDGAANAGRAAARAGVPMILLSSLAAREPSCSRYATSKRRGEEAVMEEMAARQLTVVRPPAVYGPGDPVTMPIFRQIEQGWLIAPAAEDARFSMIFVDDLAELLLSLVEDRRPGEILEPDDGKPGGYSWRDVAEIARRLTNKPVRLVRLPRWLLSWPAKACDIAAKAAGRPMILSSDKLGELYHPDWRSTGLDWQPRFDFEAGAEMTLNWYRERNWQLAQN